MRTRRREELVDQLVQSVFAACRAGKKSLKSLGRSWLGVSLALSVVAWLASPLVPLLGFIAPALLVAVLLPALGRLATILRRNLSRRPWLEPALVCCGAVLLTWATFGFLIAENRIIDTKDHDVMIPRTRELIEGGLQNWTHFFQGGDALYDLYPFTPALLMGLLKTLSSLSFEQCYSLVVLSAWGLRGIAAYALVRRFSGPMVSSVLTLATLYDVGENVWDGTWSAALHWGVLHSNFALSFAALSIAYQIDLTRKVTTRGVVACGLFAALAVASHVLGFMYLVLGSGALILATLVLPGRKRRFWWAATTALAGMLLPFWWFLPYVRALQEIGFNYSEQGLLYVTVGEGFFRGLHPSGQFSGFVGFGMVAVIAAFTTRQRRLFAPALCTVLVIGLMLASLLGQTGAYEYFPGLLRAQPMRMYTLLKVVSLPLLAWLMSTSFRHLSKPRAEDALGLARRTLVITLLMFIVVVPTYQYLAAANWSLQQQVAPNRAEPHPVYGTEVNASLRSAMDWIGARRAEDSSATPWRMATYWPGIRRFGLWSQAWRIKVPLVDMAGVPGNFLGIRPRERSPVSFKEWNIRYVVTPNATPLLPRTSEKYRAGEYVVWQVNDYDDRFVVAPPGVSVEELSVDGDTMRFRVSGVPQAGAGLRVRCAWFPRWRAWLEGAELDVERVAPFAGAKPKQEQIGIFVSKDGWVELRCTGLMPGFWTGLALALMGVLALAVAGAQPLRTGFERRISTGYRWLGQCFRGLVDRHRVRAVTLILGIPLVWLVVALVRGARELRMPGPLGSSLSVMAEDARGVRVECPKKPLGVGFFCAHPRTSVISWFGKDAPVDQSGEFAFLWSGIQVVLAEDRAKAELEFERINLRGQRLVFKYESAGKIALTGSIDGQAIPQRPLVGSSVTIIDLPTGVSGSGTVVLRFVGNQPGSWVTFRAHVE